MNLRLPPSIGTRPGRRGSSLVEILIASSIALLVVGAFMLLILETSTEQRWGIVETQLHSQAGLLQDRLTRLLRQMSATESSIYGDPVQNGAPIYRRLIVAEGEAPATPRQELVYVPNSMTLIHDPDRNVGGNEVVLMQSASPVKLRTLYFFPSMKPDGTPDSASINIHFELDDDGASGRFNPDGSSRPVSVVRTFTVAMRNM